MSDLLDELEAYAGSAGFEYPGPLLARAADRIEALEAALAFYADADAWDEYESDKRSPDDRQFGSTLGSDRGDIARAALKRD